MNTAIKPDRLASYQEQMFLDKLRMLFTNLYISTPVNFLCATIVFFSLYQSAYSHVMLGWYIAVIFISIVRFSGVYVFHLFPQRKNLLVSVFMFGVLMSGALWGFCASYLMPPENLLQQTIVIVIIAGVTAGGLQMLQASFAANALYLAIVIFPVCAWLFSQKGISYLILGGNMTCYLIFTLITAWRGFKVIEQSLRLSYDNVALIDDLSASHKKLTEAYHTIEDNEIRLRDIQENAPLGMSLISLAGEWLEINHALCDILGYNKGELKKLSLQQLIYPDDYQDMIDAREKMRTGHIERIQSEQRYVHKNGHLIWVLTNESLLHDSQGTPLYFISQMQDISDRKKNELMVKELNEKTNLMLTQLQQREFEMSFINKMNETLQTCQESHEAYSIIGNAANELFEQLDGGLAIADVTTHHFETMQEWGDNRTLKRIISPKDCWALRTGHAYVVDSPKNSLVCHHFESELEGGYMCIPQISQNGAIGLMVLMAPKGEVISSHQQQLANNFNDVIKLSLINIRLLEMLNEQSIHDPLTKLYNRRFLDETIPRELLRIDREGQHLCICMVDIDFFKRFNDDNGHEAGDEVLKLIGQLLLSNTRKNDIVCRYGGEEFVIIFIDTDLQAVIPKLQYICDKVRGERVYFRGESLPQITISVGVAEAPAHGQTMKDILRAADEALYSAKQNGRDCINIFGQGETIGTCSSIC
jgi:diguanylate cyclase (GGDEF)-like protein/PAS domain S-box-containing protein